jgi:hypothetical protein
MQFKNGEILASPKTIYWFEMPVAISEHEKIELLKKDVLLINYQDDLETMISFKDNIKEISAFFYNFDNILTKKKVFEENKYTFSEKFILFIKELNFKNNLIHTTQIDNKLSNLFKQNGIIYLEKNFNDKRVALSIISALINPFFSNNMKIKRSFLRLNLTPMKYKIIIQTNRTNNIFGYVKDLSLNGMGIYLINQNDFNFFNLKDLINLKISIKQSIITINNAIISRINKESMELGITYDINSNKMIREDYATYLTGLIYGWLKELINKYGVINT